MTRMTVVAAVSAIAIGALSGCHSMGWTDEGARGSSSMTSGSGSVYDSGSHPLGVSPTEEMTRNRESRGDIWSH